MNANAEEIVDVVDDQDTVISQCSKAEAHEKGLLHRTVIAEIVNSRGEWVLVKQAGDRQDPGQYVSPVGGHVRAGESIEDAVRREAHEEMGLTDVTPRLIGKAVFDRTVRDHRENHLFILFEITSDAKPQLNEESVGYEYFSRDMLKKELKLNPQKFGAAYHFIVQTFYPDLIS